MLCYALLQVDKTYNFSYTTSPKLNRNPNPIPNPLTLKSNLKTEN